ncbi:MAG: hypothetical protein ABMA13_22830 [Chthoniobacteraceae bacterium]
MLKALDLWLPSWMRRKRDHAPLGSRHLILSVCDHFEPLQRGDKPGALERIGAWRRGFPGSVAGVVDSGGQAPRHTFFYPVEKYDPDIVGEIAALCAETACEIEVHLHHDDDTAENLRRTLREATGRLAGHGALCRDESGALRFGFIHGNWALDHSHPDGRFCGVQDELAVLREAGCYADFTLPSAPERTQTRRINSLHYATEDGQPRSHERGRRVVAGREVREQSADELLIVQGPLGLNWDRRKFGVLPRIENSDLTGTNPPTLDRLRVWLECRISVLGRPNWIFAKLHTHGAKPENTAMFLGEPMRAFHRALAQVATDDPSFRYHYVSAREMVNIIHAAEAGHSGDPGQFRDFRYRRLKSSSPAAPPAVPVPRSDPADPAAHR